VEGGGHIYDLRFWIYDLEKAVTTRFDETWYSALPLSYGPVESGKVGPEGF
jgi:hypothetical protein